MSARDSRRSCRPMSAAAYTAYTAAANSTTSASSNAATAANVATASRCSAVNNSADNDAEYGLSGSTAATAAVSTAAVPLMSETDLDNLERDDIVSELSKPNVGSWRDRTRATPNRSVTLIRNYDKVVNEFEDAHRSAVMRRHSEGPRVRRTLSRRESVRVVLRNGSVRAARVASMIVVPSNRIDTDYKVEDWIENYTCLPPPIFMIIISLVELAVFIGYAIHLNGSGIMTTAASGVPEYSPLIYQPTRRYELWRFLTYMFIHNGYFHIVSNLVFQLLIGLPLEMVHDFWRVGPLYLIGVLAGSLATSVVDPWVLLCGASGGCYSLLGAQFATITMNWKEMKAGWLDSPLKFLLSGPFQLTFWMALAIINTSMSIYSRFSDSRTAFAAHIAGLISGYLIGLCVLKNFDDRAWKWKLRVTSFATFGVLVVFAILFNTFYVAYYPPTDWRQCCPLPPSSWYAYNYPGHVFSNHSDCVVQTTDSLLNVSSRDTSPPMVYC